MKLVTLSGSINQGYRMADAIAKAGAKAIAILDPESEPRAYGEASVIRLHRDTNILARLYSVDLRSEEGMEKAMAEIDNDLGSLDILLDFSPVLK